MLEQHQHDQRCQRLKEKQRIAERNKDTAYYLVKTKSLGTVLLCPAEEEVRFLGGFKAGGQSYALQK